MNAEYKFLPTDIPDLPEDVATKLFFRYAFSMIDALRKKGTLDVINCPLEGTDRVVKGTLTGAEIKEGALLLYTSFDTEIEQIPPLELLVSKGEFGENQDIVIALDNGKIQTV